MTPDTTKITNQYDNRDFENSSALEVRLNPNSIIQEIRRFLSGKDLVSVYENGKTQIKEISIGEPIVNKIGLQSMISCISLLINTQTVQGNFNRDMYHEYIGSVRDTIYTEIIKNRILWGINEEHTSMIVNWIMNCVKPYISRTIDNLERDSYSNTISTKETLVGQNQEEKKRFF